MKKLINTSVAKYVVNVLMIVLFAGSAITGLFFMEGGERSVRGHEKNLAQITEEMEISDQIDMQGYASFNRHRDFESERGEGSEGIHQIIGIIWLILMFLHTIQHWNWYKKMFTLKYIRQNKLLTGTLVLFALLVLTSIGLLTEIIPRGLFDLKEIHGFIGQVLIGLVVIHIIQRFNWYVTITQKLFNRKTVLISTI